MDHQVQEQASRPASSLISQDSDEHEEKESARLRTERISLASSQLDVDAPQVLSQAGRPCLERIVRQPIEEAYGETAVIACGAANFVADLRNFVARLSDERAVHKGTGAQGIYLFTESYGW